MPKTLMTKQLLEIANSDIYTLQMDKQMPEGEEVPTPAESSAIKRVQQAAKEFAAVLSAELEGLS